MRISLASLLLLIAATGCRTAQVATPAPLTTAPQAPAPPSAIATPAAVSAFSGLFSAGVTPVPARPTPGEALAPQAQPAAPAQPAPGALGAVAQPIQAQLASHQAPAGTPPPAAAQPATAPPATPPINPGLPVQVDGFTLEYLEQLAVGSNPALSRAAAEIEAARGHWLQVGLPPNPSAGYSGQQLGSGGQAEQHGVFAEQEWVRGNKLGLNRQVAAQEVAKAEQRYQVQCQRVRTDLRIAYYQVLVAQRQQQLAAQIRDIASQGLTNAERLFQAKEVGRGDVVQARIELENAHILVDNSANRAAAAWRSLAAVTGVAGLVEKPLLGALDNHLPDYTFTETLRQILACSPEIAVASAEAERARWALQRAGVEKTPNVTFQGLVNWQDNGINGEPDGSVIASLPLPLWNRNQGGVSKAYAEIAAAEQALAQLELSLQNRLAPVFERYANARQQVVRYQTVILPAAEEALTLVQRTYQASETNYASLLVAQRTFIQTRLGYLEALQNLRESQAQIDGMLLSGSLASP